MQVVTNCTRVAIISMLWPHYITLLNVRSIVAKLADIEKDPELKSANVIYVFV